jgi:hypothetical protein
MMTDETLALWVVWLAVTAFGLIALWREERNLRR